MSETQVEVKKEKMDVKANKKKEVFLADTKTLFDAIRNMGLCMIFIFAAHFGLPNDTALLSGIKYAGYAVGVFLILLNIAWAYQSSIEKGIGILTVIGLAVLFLFQGYGLYQLKDMVLDTPSEIKEQKIVSNNEGS